MWDWSRCKNLPQYKYLARPVYKLFVPYDPIVATALSFFISDLVLHQFFPQIAKCMIDNIVSYPSSCRIYWSMGHSLMWMSLALPVMYAKYKKSN